jgi:4-hydroxy-tetrahydrodipicolinate reductase
MVRIMSTKKSLQVVGAITKRRNVGKDLGEVAGIGKKLGITVSNDIDAVLSQTKADVMVDATGAHTRAVFSHLLKAVEAGLNVVTICEEMTNPWLKEPELARRLDKAAKSHGVTVVATGTNPGFYLDVLPLMIASACAEVKKLRVQRVVDMSGIVDSLTVLSAFGIGLAPEEVERKLAAGEITLHVGLPETMHLLADALGWKLTEVREERKPVVSRIARDFPPFVKIEPGQSYGCKYNGYGFIDGEMVMSFEGTLCLSPTLKTDGMEPCFTLWVEGDPEIKVSLEGVTIGHNIMVVTAARAVNWIPSVVKAKPGLLTSLEDFPLVGYCK